MTVRGLHGSAIAAVAVVSMLWSVSVLRSWRLLSKVEAGHELCTTGPYGLVRHPICEFELPPERPPPPEPPQMLEPPPPRAQPQADPQPHPHGAP